MLPPVHLSSNEDVTTGCVYAKKSPYDNLYLEIGGERFRNEFMPTHYLIQHFVRLYGRFDIAFQHLHAEEQNTISVIRATSIG